MFPIYFSESTKYLETGRLWRITKDGKVNYVLGTNSLENSALLNSGTPELNYIFNKASKILFEAPDLKNIREEAPLALKHALEQKVPDKLLKRMEQITQQLPNGFKGFVALATQNINQYYSQNHPDLKVSQEQLKSLNFIALYELAMRIKYYLKPATQCFDNVLFKEATKRRPPYSEDEAINIESFAQNLQASYDMALNNNDEILEGMLSVGWYKIINEKKLIKNNHSNLDVEVEYLSGALSKYKNSLVDFDKQALIHRDKLMSAEIERHFAHGNMLACLTLLNCTGQGGVLELLQNNGALVARVFETHNVPMLERLLISDLLKMRPNRKFLGTAALLFAIADFALDDHKQVCGIMLAFTLAIPLFIYYMRRTQMLSAITNNSGPEYLRNEMQARSKTLYDENAQPVIKRTMILTQYMHQTRMEQYMRQAMMEPPKFIAIEDLEVKIKARI